MSVTLAVCFVLMILAPCLLALRGRWNDREVSLLPVETASAPSGLSAEALEDDVPVVHVAGAVAAEVEVTAVAVAAEAPVISATTMKVAAEMAAKAAEAKAQALAVVAPIVVAREIPAPLVIASAAIVPAVTAPVRAAVARRIETAPVPEQMNPNEMTLEQLLARAEYEAGVAEAAALRANVAASDAAARAAAMRANAAIDAARYARSIAAEAAETARAMRATMNGSVVSEEAELGLQKVPDRRRAA